MGARQSKDFFKNYYGDVEVETPPAEHRCHRPDCKAEGLFKAPKSREDLENHLWFCTEHIQEYNARWDYLKGLTAAQIEQEIRADVFWRRPTWQKGDSFRTTDFEGDADIFGFFKGKQEGTHNTGIRQTVSDEVSHAMITMNVSFPLTQAELKKVYKARVKQHHPDVNGGSKTAEEKLKAINIAYKVIEKFLNDELSSL